MRTGVYGAASAAAVISLASSAAVAQVYEVGSSWNRLNQWTAGAVNGGTDNNPGPDWSNSPVWHYDWTTGGSLQSETPWYQQSLTRMTWDSSWWNTGFSVWSRGDNQSAPIHDRVMTHNLLPGEFDYIPVVSWVNPVPGMREFQMSGDLTVRWAGPGRVGSPVDVDVVVALKMGEIVVPLLSTTVSKPTQHDSVWETLSIPVNFTSIPMQQGESLIFSMRGRDTFGPQGRWVDMFDNTTITLVPAPGAMALLGLGGVALLRRRR